MRPSGSAKTAAARLQWAILVLGLSLAFLFFAGESDPLPEATSAPASVANSPAPQPAPPIMPVVAPAADAHRFDFAREGVLGTSFDLTVITDHRGRATAVEARILQEIAEREKLISTYRPDSEISRLNALPVTDNEQVDVSYSLWLLLADCLRVQKQSAGAFDVYLGAATDRWREAAKSQRPPADEELQQLQSGPAPGFEISSRRQGRWVRRHRPGSFDFDAVGKGYIIDKCVREAVSEFPLIRGLRLDIGGEIKVWGQSDYAHNRPWPIGVTDPKHPADNAAPVTVLELRNLAIATSGDYARSKLIAGRSVNHILDPRTARPVSPVRSATVVAADAVRADALATALCVMPPEAGVAMIDALSDAACLIIDPAGRQFRSASFASMEAAPPDTNRTAWPAGQVVTLNFELVRSEDRAPFHRHYVGAWVEDAQGRRVRILALWAKPGDIGYVRDLNEFWRDAWILAGEGNDTGRLLGFSRATRAPGAYSLSWDGLNDAGRPVPQGRYTLHLDVNREKGPPGQRERHTHSQIALDCGATPTNGTAPDQPELRNVRATCRPIGGVNQP